MNENKKCTRCSEVKSLEEFSNRKYNRDGKSVYCKECVKKEREEQKQYKIIYNYVIPKDTKICNKCGETKSLDEFHNLKRSKDGKQGYCKECSKIYIENNKEHLKEYSKKYSIDNKEHYQEYQKQYNKEHKEERLEYQKEYDKTEGRKVYHQKHFQKHKRARVTHQNEYNKEKRKTDPLYKLYDCIQTRIYGSLKKKGIVKSKRTEEMLGCTIEEFKLYIESKFESWMSWDKYGLYNGEFNYGFDLDHIIPVSSAQTEADLLTLNHYSNFQPLCSKINRDIKKARLDYES